MHVWKQIRDAVKSNLAGLSVKGIHTNRIRDLTESDLPAVVILTEDENNQRMSKSARLNRSIDVVVVAILDGNSDTIDDDLDAMAEQIEPLLKNVATAEQFTLVASTNDFLGTEEGDQYFAYRALEYQATAFTD